MHTSHLNSETNPSPANEKIIVRLIYFWAFAEAGLGGIMHLLHIPLTGFIIGGFSVIINVLLAKYSYNSSAIFLKAVSIVLAVKFLLSPYTPVGAYIAVGFQGLLAVGLFPLFGLNRLTILAFSLMVMIESSLQKPLFALIVLGKEFWNSMIKLLIDTFGISRENITSGAEILFIFYLTLYIVWGVIIAKWSNNLRLNIENTNIAKNEVERIKIRVISNDAGRIKKPLSFIIPVIVLGLLLLIPIAMGNFSLFYALRTVTLLISILILFPLLIKKHQSFLFAKYKKEVVAITAALPSIKAKTIVAWKLSEQHTGHRKVKHFVINAIWLNVFYE